MYGATKSSIYQQEKRKIVKGQKSNKEWTSHKIWSTFFFLYLPSQSPVNFQSKIFKIYEAVKGGRGCCCFPFSLLRFFFYRFLRCFPPPPPPFHVSLSLAYRTAPCMMYLQCPLTISTASILHIFLFYSLLFYLYSQILLMV